MKLFFPMVESINQAPLAMDAKKSELGLSIPSRASISSVKEDSRKDRIGRRISRTKNIRVDNRKLAQLAKIGTSMERCIAVPDRLMLPG